MDGHLSLRTIAQEHALTVSHLCTLFSHALGVPFRTYLKNWRLHKARALLRDESLSIKEIAYRVGYNDPNRLRLEFKDVTGHSPRAWRESAWIAYEVTTVSSKKRRLQVNRP